MGVKITEGLGAGSNPERGALAADLALLFGWSIESSQSWGTILVCLMIFLWAVFGVYRTIVQARAPKQYTDLV